MKKLMKSIFVLSALSVGFLSSCTKDETDSTKESLAPTVVINGGIGKTTISANTDSFLLDIQVSADTDRKIKSVYITRAISGGATDPIVNKTYNDAAVILKHYDLVKGVLTIDDGDKMTYSVKVTDDKDKVTTATFEVTINSVSVSEQILLGAPSNTTNEYRFFGVANSFARYRAGATGTELARSNSDKIDFLYFYNSAGSVGNALYSPNYNFSAGTGWATEVSSWTTKKETVYLLTDLSLSAFDGLTTKTFFDELDALTWTSAIDRMPNLEASQVLAYKRGDGKRGFILVAATAANATTGVLTVKVKAEL
ncbi:hypothetical protein MASR2M44_27430 [Bacteroidota bacterium]